MTFDEYVEETARRIKAEIANECRGSVIRADIDAAYLELRRVGVSPALQNVFWRKVAEKVRHYFNNVSYKSQSSQALVAMVDATTQLLEEIAARAAQ